MSEQKAGADDEVDIGQLFQRIGARFAQAWMSFVRFLALMRRLPLENRWSFLGIITASLIVSVIYGALLQKRYYESSMILSSVYLNKRMVDNAIENLDLLAEEESSSGLAKVLNIPDTLAENLIGFEAHPFISEEEVISLEILRERLQNASEEGVQTALVDQVLKQIEVENRHSFEITIQTLKPEVMPNLQTAIVSHLRNNEFVRRRIEIQKVTLTEKRNKLALEMKRLDSLKDVIYENYQNMAKQARNGSNNVILSDKSVIDPVQIFNQDLAIYREWEDVNRELYVQSDFEVVDGFTEFTEPMSPSIGVLALIALLVGVVTAYLDVAMRSLNNYLANLK